MLCLLRQRHSLRRGTIPLSMYHAASGFCAFMAVTHAIIIYVALDANGLEVFRYFCTYNWIGQVIFFSSLSLNGLLLASSHLLHRALLILYGGSTNMTLNVMRYWPDSFTNPEHFYAHYFSTAVFVTLIFLTRKELRRSLALNTISSLRTALCRAHDIFVLVCAWPLFYFVLMHREAPELYGIPFPHEYQNICICLALPYLVSLGILLVR